MLSCDVPGVSIARSIQRRDATGKSWICCVDTDVDTSDFVVSTIGDSPVTVTASAMRAGLSVKLMTASWSMMRTMSGRVSAANPDKSVETVYVPGGSAGMRKSPVPWLTAERVSPVAMFLAVTVTPGSTAPVWSLMVPLTCAFCAKAAVEVRTTRATTRKPRDLTGLRIPLSSLCERESMERTGRCQRLHAQHGSHDGNGTEERR